MVGVDDIEHSKICGSDEKLICLPLSQSKEEGGDFLPSVHLEFSQREVVRRKVAAQMFSVIGLGR